MDQNSLARVVTEHDTAAALDASLPAAASTPFVLALAEGACHGALADRIGEGELSVGARAEIDHLAPSRVGAELLATATLVGENERRFAFDVEVVDEGRVVARVKHTRVVLPEATIMRQLGPAD